MQFIVQDSIGSETINGTMDESLIEALESIKESKQAVKRLTRQPSPLQVVDLDRITDYPRNSSPDSSLARTPLSGSRCSSLSTMSQSSLTSDSSFSFDANKRPRKKILKNPHRMHRHSRNRVRWNLPGSEMNDSDNMSLESFDSTSTQSSVYLRAKRGVADAKTNWREFERHPSPGSTGMTPAKPPMPRNGFNQHTTSSSSVSSGSPLHISNYQSSSFNPPQIRVSGIPRQEPPDVTRLRRSPSPLTISPPTSTYLMGSLHTSTPMRRINSDPAAAAAMRKSPISEHSQLNNSTSSNNEDDDIDIPILQFDHSKLSMLEESTLEDKKRAHIFPFTQNDNAPSSSTPVKTPPAVRTAFLDDDDASDYDHLSPLANLTSDEKKKQTTNSNDSDSMYTKEDIDDAFDALGSSGSSNGSIIPPPMAEVPPPIPHKKNEAHYRLRTASQDSAKSDASGSLSPTSPKCTTPSPVSQSNKSNTKQMLTNYSRNNNISSPQHTSTTQNKPKPKSPQKPPPVPPKTRRTQRMDREREDTSGNRQKSTGTISSTSQSGKQSTQYHTQTNIFDGEYSNSPEDEIFPPPPEFALTQGDQDDVNPVSLSQGSDLFSSVSNSTLVDESQQEGSPELGVTSKYRTKAENPPPVPAHSKHTSAHSQNIVYPMMRIVVGAEDPKQVRDNPPLIQRQQQFSSRSVIQAYQNDKIFRDQQHKSQVTSNSRLPTSQSAHFHYSQTKARASSLSVTPTSPRHKISMEMAFNEGNILNHAKFMPPNHKTHQTRTTADLTSRGLNAAADSNRQQLALRGRSQSVAANSNQNGSASDEQQVWKTFNSRSTGGGIPPTSRTVGASDNDLNTLFKDLEIKENSTCKEQPQPSSFGEQFET